MAEFEHYQPNDLKTCPQCMGSVDEHAKVCRYCGYKFSNYYLAGCGMVALMVLLAVLGCSPRDREAARARKENDIVARHMANLATTYPAIIREEMKLDDICRGSSDDSPKVRQACTRRGVLSGKIESMGWCFSEAGEVGADTHWRLCSGREVAPILPRHIEWIEACHGMIRQALDDPDSAEFPDPEESPGDFYYEINGDLFTERFLFRARNQFGALVRQQGECIWEDNFDGTARMINYFSR